MSINLKQIKILLMRYLLCGSALYFCGYPVLAAGLPIEVATAEVASIARTIPVFGQVKTSKTIDVMSLFAGRITYLDAQVGDHVKKHALIARIRRKEAEALYGVGAVPKGLKDTVVLSPISGYITQSTVVLNQQITSGQSMVSIMSDNHYFIEFEISGEYLKNIKLNMPISYLLADKVMQANLTKIVPIADPQTGFFKARAYVDAPEIYTGQVVQARLQLAQKKTLTIPRSALLNVEGLPFVYVIQKGKALLRQVGTGIRSEKRIEITQGLNEGDKVATQGNYDLSDGASVEIQTP